MDGCEYSGHFIYYEIEVGMDAIGIMVGDPLEWLTLPVGPKKRISSSFDNWVILHYKCLFIRIRLWLHLYDFNVFVLKHLKVSPSHLYLRSWV